MDMFSRDSSLSKQSFNSAANYNHYNDQTMHMNKYVNKHPLTELLNGMGWNNIPLPLKEMFHLLCDAMVGQDVHTWERKCTANERFNRLQDGTIKLQSRIRKTKTEIAHKLKTIEEEAKTEKIKNTHEMNKRLNEGFKQIQKEGEEMKLQVSKLSGVIKNRKKEDEAMKKLLMGHIELSSKRSREANV